MPALAMACLTVGFVAISAGSAGAACADPPTLEQLVQRLGRYVDQYGERMAVVVGTEHYTQRESASKSVRELVSEIALLQVNGDWVGYRDVFQADGVGIPDRQNRLRRRFETAARIVAPK